MGVPLTLSSVPAVTPYIQYVATSNQTVFPYPFPITQDSDLIVVVNGVTLATDNGYTLSGQGQSGGGNVTFTLGQSAGTIVTLYRNISIQRITQIGQNSGYSSTTLNAEFNNLYLIAQQLQEATALCLQIPNTNNPAPTTLLAPAAYANKYLSFDANGNPTPAVLTTSGSLTLSIIASLLFPLTAGQTAAEVAASVVPVNPQYPPLHAWRYIPNLATWFANQGSTDVTAALSNWIKVVNQAGYLANQSFAAAYLPAGGYLISAALPALTSSKLRLYGDGSDVSRIIVASGANSFAAMQAGNNYPSIPNSATAYNIQIEGIGLQRLSGTGAVTLLRVINTQYCHYRDLTLYDLTGAGSVVANVTGATAANPMVVTVNTVSASNPFYVGQTVTAAGFGGMTQVNGCYFTVTAIGGVSGAWTVTLSCNSTGFTAYTAGGTLTAPSAGLEYRGHENNTFENVWITNMAPLILGNPSGNLGDGCDHTEYRGMELQSSTDAHPLVTVATGNQTTLSNQNWTGNQIWLGGKRGFYWNDPGPGNSAQVGGNLSFAFVRREQASVSSTGESVYVKTGGTSGGPTNDSFTNISIKDGTFGLLTAAAGGFFFDGVNWVTMENVNLSVGGVGINMTARANANSTQLTLINCNLDQAAMNLTNLEKVFGSSSGVLVSSQNNTPQTCIYQYTDANFVTFRGMQVYEGKKWVGKRAAVTTGSTFVIPSSSGSTTGIATITCSVGAGSQEGGIILLNNSATVLLVGTTNVVATATAGKLSISWSAGSSAYIVTNQLGNTRDILVEVTWQ